MLREIRIGFRYEDRNEIVSVLDPRSEMANVYASEIYAFTAHF